MSVKYSLDNLLSKAKSFAKKGNIEEAVKLYQAILSDFPKNVRAQKGLEALQTNLGKGPPQEEIKNLVNLYNKRQFSASIQVAQLIIREYPQAIIAWNIVGGAYEALGEFEQALIAFKKVIELNPNYVDGYYNIGVALQNQGKIDEAIKAYQKCISINENFTDAYVNLGIALRHLGNIEDSIEVFTKVLLIKPHYAEAYYHLAPSLKGIYFKKNNSKLIEIITSLLNKKTFVRPRYIIDAGLSLLKLDTKLKKHLELDCFDGNKLKTLEVIADLSKLPLLLKLMTVCPITDIDLERLLKKLRAKLIMSIDDYISSPDLLTFQSALALQCFTNEYLYDKSVAEDKALLLLDESVKLDISNNRQPSPKKILSLASYKPLKEYVWSSSLIITDEIKEVFTRQIIEPEREIEIRQSLPILNNINNEVSSKVRNQYESNPYPRWVNLRLRSKSVPISKLVSEIKLNLFDHKIKEVKAPNILVAGCGTGEHSIGTAKKLKDSKVIAVDLSASSLSYAKRKTEELNINNIDYMQADILNLDKLDRQFDIVESVGVLHHMDDPIAGWRVLKNCLKYGGLMKIGLYSELARKHIVEMREEIHNDGIGSSDADMKSYRNMLIKSNKTHHKLILNSSDLYSMSTLKDLLFHVQEHRFTITQIQECLSNLGLKFCGFETNSIVSHFKLTYNNEDDLYNLNKWKEYEEANPRAFLEMYQFWCQKIA